MPEIREQFKWGNNFDKNNNKLPRTVWVLLKDMSTSHISGVIRYFTENIIPEQVLTKQWIAYHLIFCYELENRLNVEMQGISKSDLKKLVESKLKFKN